LDEPYVYYPIYSGEEAGYLTVEHFWARNQFALIKEISLSLPVEYKLYVKEHPWNPGEFSFAQLKELKKMKNIRIVDPRTNGQSLIKNSEAVVVLQSFTGWEAYLYQKPAVVLGSAFYTFSTLFYRVKNITELSTVLWRALDKKTNVYKENQAEWLWSIYGMITSGHKGMFVNKKPPYGFPDDRDNSKQMAEAIAKKMTREI
jgi:capsule polysaccharide modification protein KpsS